MMFNASLFEDVEQEVQHRHPVDEATVWKKLYMGTIRLDYKFS